MSDVLFRDLAGMAEFRAAEALQRDVWGNGDKEDPADLMMVIQSEGGLVAGAFLDQRLVGYIFGFPTRDPQIQHSHRLAVHPDARGLKLGTRLKHYQRDWCLAHGITLVRWTYDPLRIANATLNIARLGAISNHYLPNYYGEMGGINEGPPSDRLLVDWHLNAPRVTALASGTAFAETTSPRPTRDIAIAPDFETMLVEDPAGAVRARLDLRADLLDAFATGWTIVDFDNKRLVYRLAQT